MYRLFNNQHNDIKQCIDKMLINNVYVFYKRMYRYNLDHHSVCKLQNTMYRYSTNKKVYATYKTMY